MPIDRAGTIRTSDQPPASIVISDLTRDGCRIEAPMPLAKGTPISVGIAGVGLVEAEVRWRDGASHGCAFVEPLKSGAVTAAVLSNVHPFPGQGDVAEPMAIGAKLSTRLSMAALTLVGAAGWGVVLAGWWLLD